MLFVRFRLSAVRYRLEADSKQPKTESGKRKAESEQPTPAPPKRGIYAPKPEADS
jgi:hypothetical protein